MKYLMKQIRHKEGGCNESSATPAGTVATCNASSPSRKVTHFNLVTLGLSIANRVVLRRRKCIERTSRFQRMRPRHHQKHDPSQAAVGIFSLAHRSTLRCGSVGSNDNLSSFSDLVEEQVSWLSGGGRQVNLSAGTRSRTRRCSVSWSFSRLHGS